MSIQFEIAKQIITETCPKRKIKLENIRLFADIIQPFTFLLKETSIKGKIGNKEDISNLETYCVFNSDYPFYYRKWANDDKLSAANMAEELKKDIETIQKIIIPLLPPQTSVPPF